MVSWLWKPHAEAVVVIAGNSAAARTIGFNVAITTGFTTGITLHAGIGRNDATRSMVQKAAIAPMLYGTRRQAPGAKTCAVLPGGTCHF